MEIDFKHTNSKRKLSHSDKKFLNDLRFELNTQSTYGEADPRFWVVMQTVKDFGIEDGYEDGVAMYDSEDTNCIYYELSECNDLIENVIIDNWQDTNVIKSYDIHLENDIMTITTINNNDKEDVWELNSLEDVKNFLNDELLCYSDRYKIVGYRNREEIVANTFFLSIEECKRYIKLNAYHYNNPHPYAMTALGSYQMKKLIEILHNTDWNL